MTEITKTPWNCDYLDDGRGERLFVARGVAPSPSRGTLVLCDPIGEEAKSAFAVTMAFCRECLTAGWNVIRFDYPGMGDSDGEFARDAPWVWTRSAARVLRTLGQTDAARSAASPLVLIGLRLGANIAAVVAETEGRHVDAAVLWSPITNLERYARALQRASRPFESEEALDVHGWRLPLETRRRMEDLWPFGGPPLACPSLLVSISGRKRPDRATEGLARRLGPRSRYAHVRALPFWQPTGVQDCPALTVQTLRWLENLGAGRSAP